MSAAVTEKGTVYAWGNSRIPCVKSSEVPQEIYVPNCKRIREIALSPTFMVLISNNKPKASQQKNRS
jgi:hypothetical protein